jgi:hypothetical protein
MEVTKIITCNIEFAKAATAEEMAFFLNLNS